MINVKQYYYDQVSELYLATFSSGISKVYLVTLWPVDLQNFSKVYIAYFDPCIQYKRNIFLICFLSLSLIGLVE